MIYQLSHQGSPKLNLLPLNSLSKGDAKMKNIYLFVSHAYLKVTSGGEHIAYHQRYQAILPWGQNESIHLIYK